jgi:hypothetical protein
LKNEDLVKALEETWKNKEKFYEDTKGLSMLEIIRGIENKYKVQGIAHTKSVCASPPYGGSGYANNQSGVR